jgi:CheY-like chemotaxis protein
LVRRLLAFARRQTLEPRAIDMAALQDAVADLLTHTLGGLVSIDWQAEDGVWKPFADQAQLELALMNLIINARDAMPAGGTVTVLAENRSIDTAKGTDLNPGEYVLLSIKDSGTGISAEHLSKVMEPFFTTKDVGKGTGLGLSMVYGFAKQSNGAFRLESEIGRGTTAELWLPRAPAGNSTTAAVSAEETGTGASVCKLRILLVDDHAEVRGTTAAMLEDLGHEVVQLSSGAEALEALRGGDCDYDLMISDYAMPHLSGTEFLRAARDLCPDIPSLIITGYAEEDTIDDRPDGVEILLKPFTAAKLEAAVARGCRAPAVTR